MELVITTCGGEIFNISLLKILRYYISVKLLKEWEGSGVGGGRWHSGRRYSDDEIETVQGMNFQNKT